MRRRRSAASGRVYLVGAGPGDPGLLTLRGQALLRSAERVVYDALVSPEVLRLASPGAELVFAGRRGRDPAGRQKKIDALLVEGARRGLSVVRLKGGDPFLFGRGGEEAETLAAAGVEFEIVPGVTSAIAAPAYAGIPLTHRAHASSALITTAHEDPRRPGSRLRWDLLAQSADTLVFLMVAENLARVLHELRRHGRAPATPAALIEWGTWPRQRTVQATLSTLGARARRAHVGPPCVLVVGEVVRLRERLAWLERRPLFGRRVLVTRAQGQAGELARALSDAGAEVIEFPTLELLPPASWKAADRAIASLDAYDWVLFTSVNGVDAFMDRVWKQGKDVRALGGARLGAIGPATAARLEERGLRVELRPGEYRAEAVVEALRGRVRGARILIPRARVARDILPESLRRQEGARVDVVEVYQTRPPRADSSWLRRDLQQRRIDAVTFTASSTVHNFVRALGKFDLPAVLSRVVVACIGPITADTARSYGFKPRVQPSEYTVPHLVRALIQHFKSFRAGTRRPR